MTRREQDSRFNGPEQTSQEPLDDLVRVQVPGPGSRVPVLVLLRRAAAPPSGRWAELLSDQPFLGRFPLLWDQGLIWDQLPSCR